MAVSTSQGVLHDLFTPLPEAEPDPVEKSFCDHVADYASTSFGSWDVFRIGNHIFSALGLYLSANHSLIPLVEKAKNVFNTAGIALSIPQLFSDCNNLRKSIGKLLDVQHLADGDPLKNRKMTQAAKKTFLDSVTLTNTLAQIGLFIENVKLFIFEPMDLCLTDGVYNTTSVIGDGAELFGEYYKIQQFNTAEAQARTVEEATKLQEKTTLAWMTIAKDVASLALGFFTLGTLAFGIVVTGIMPAVLLGVSAFWLTMKLTAYFYNKVVVEATGPALPGFI